MACRHARPGGAGRAPALPLPKKESRLLARAVFVVDREGAVRYTQVVPEITDEPDYEAILGAVRQVA